MVTGGVQDSMANHYRDALDKLSPVELSALVAPLAGLLRMATREQLDPQALERFLDRYDAALAAHDHEVLWVAPNGERFDGTVATGEGTATRPSGEPPWRQLVFRVTGGELGQPNLPMGALLDLRTASVTTLMRSTSGTRPILLWTWDGTAPPRSDVVTRARALAKQMQDGADVVALGAGGDFSEAEQFASALPADGLRMLWESEPRVVAALAPQPDALMLTSADFQRAIDISACLQDDSHVDADELLASLAPDHPR